MYKKRKTKEENNEWCKTSFRQKSTQNSKRMEREKELELGKTAKKVSKRKK